MITLAQSALAKRKAGGSGMSPGEGHRDSLVTLAGAMGRTALLQSPLSPQPWDWGHRELGLLFQLTG